MTKSQRVPITITPERQRMFEAIWERLPHLKGSVTATVDYLGSLYLDPKTPQPTNESSSSPSKDLTDNLTTKDPIETPTATSEDEW